MIFKSLKYVAVIIALAASLVYAAIGVILMFAAYDMDSVLVGVVGVMTIVSSLSATLKLIESWKYL